MCWSAVCSAAWGSAAVPSPSAVHFPSLKRRVLQLQLSGPLTVGPITVSHPSAFKVEGRRSQLSLGPPVRRVCSGDAALPVVHSWRPGPEMRRKQHEIGCVRCDDAVLEAHREHHNVCVDYVGGTRPQEHRTDHAGIHEGEVVNLESVEEPRQSGLPAAVAPHLRDHRRRCAQRHALLKRGREKGLGRLFASVDCYKHPGVEDHEAK